MSIPSDSVAICPSCLHRGLGEVFLRPLTRYFQYWHGESIFVGQVEQRPVAGVFEKFLQMLDHEILGFGVLIGELEHHSADEDLAAGVCFSFTG